MVILKIEVAMLEAKTERINHLGIIAGVIKDLKLIELIDGRSKLDGREEVSTEEAVAGMIIKGTFSLGRSRS